MDYVTVLRSGHLFQTGKMTPQQWIEGRRKLREEYHADFSSDDASRT
jgi:hypothetical protein